MIGTFFISFDNLKIIYVNDNEDYIKYSEFHERFSVS